MTALRSSIYYFLHFIEDKPILVAMFAAFHIILLLLIPIFYKPFNHLVSGKSETMSNFQFSLGTVIAIGWVLGFISQMLLFFMGVPGIKLVLIYISMYMVIIAFVSANVQSLRKQFDKFDAAKLKGKSGK